MYNDSKNPYSSLKRVRLFCDLSVLDDTREAVRGCIKGQDRYPGLLYTVTRVVAYTRWLKGKNGRKERVIFPDSVQRGHLFSNLPKVLYSPAENLKELYFSTTLKP